MSFETLTYDVADRIATITLNRPDRLNTIVPPMPDELEAAVHRATLDSHVNVIVLRGAGSITGMPGSPPAASGTRGRTSPGPPRRTVRSRNS
jgi:1,4-dihydroxy-2-naphthoyl-CoA synthase